MKLPLRITVEHPDCERFSGELGASCSPMLTKSAKGDGWSRRQQETTPLIKKWYAALGRGVTLSEELTIPSSGFSVSPDMIDDIQTKWTECFGHQHIKVQPSKIHIYGSHRYRHHADETHPDFLGTFLVGIGDTCSSVNTSLKNVLKMKDGGTRHAANARLGTWVAFATGVDFSVDPMNVPGHISFISFKIFRQPDTLGTNSNDRLVALLSRLPRPCAILLDKKYILHPDDLSSFDSHLHRVAQEVADARLLHVVINWSLRHFSEPSNLRIISSVRPLTVHYMDALQHRGDDEEETDDDEVPEEEDTDMKLDVDLTGTEWEWLMSIPEDIPFYTHTNMFEEITIPWKELIKEEREQKPVCPREEENTYFGYALVLLAKSELGRPNKRRAEAGEEGIPSKVHKVE
ncbi:hypothetical protein DFH07DRAFT_1009080 [Mycena maculata]|uniref:Uncharacterized protein n=1 Tax=Mycena maculata TaxID=230809 RepID=A0AAD7HGU1_9AGAR|nr:hypothetical protein DFH07DRAFT_1009080 [Mycena maculata]